ncbi:hypothetical protein TSUD_227990 [Trifolium subterraneum]|uniref:Uncharacterized protein n=1 Tax=Trifolium subterraneum TaxID=3900 RepID=A0A2Z6LXW9_TRISU|nr:hypothetical protein TSUD_227990 [Trifolium subterraneum]
MGSINIYSLIHNFSSPSVWGRRKAQSLDLGRKNADTSSSKNSDIDHALSQAFSGGSISDTESSIYGQNYAKYVPQGTKLPTPNRQLDSTSFYNLTSFVVVYNQENFNVEQEKLRIELRHAQGMHAIAQTENIGA